MIEVLTIGEPMGLMVADEVKPLKDVEHYTRFLCGAELNFAVGIARLKHGVAYISRVGKDPFGAHIKDFLQENKIDNRYVNYDDEFMTGMQLKAKVESGDPEVVNFRKNTAFSHMTPEDIRNIDWSTIKHLHSTGIPPALSLSCRETAGKLMDTAREKGVRISFDPNLRPALWKSKEEMIRAINHLATKADIVLPGVSEGEILMGSREPEQIADFYLQQPGTHTKTVIVKVGAEGSFVKTADGKSFKSPAFKVEHVVDTVGAGDGFAVGTISALLEGMTMEEAVHRGAAIGALAVMVRGDNEGLPTREQLQAFMHP
jgi:2-dehydro-3-deoxygluconokinase